MEIQMENPGSSRRTDDKNDRKRKLASSGENECNNSCASKEMKLMSQTPHQIKDPGTLAHVEGSKNLQRKHSKDDENKTKNTPSLNQIQPDIPAPQPAPKESSIKNILKGLSYQLKLTIINCLLSYKESRDGSPEVHVYVEHSDYPNDKFDDIVIALNKIGKLKIQAKSHSERLKLIDFITQRESNNPFAICKYFVPFKNNKQSTTDTIILTIITDAEMIYDAEMKEIWNPVKPFVTGDSTTPLDSYFTTFFDTVGGNCYKLHFDNSNNNAILNMLRQCSKRVTLARLLVKNIKSNGQKQITRNDPLSKEYRSAILYILDNNGTSKNSYRFTKEFLDSSYYSSTPGYGAFRQEFEDQYRHEFSVIGSIWDDLKQKRIYVAEAYMKDKADESLSVVLFPDDNLDEAIKTFCKQFRLLCSTKSENELDDVIVNMWRDIHCSEYMSVLDDQGMVEENEMLNTLFVKTFRWLKDDSVKGWSSKDIEEACRNIKNTAAFMRLRGISSKLRMNVMKSQFKIKEKALKKSFLYDHQCGVIEVNTSDVEFGATIALDVIALRAVVDYDILFLEDSDIINDPETVKTVFRFINSSSALIVICNEKFQQVNDIVKSWKSDIFEGTEKKAFLLRKINSITTNLSGFRICDLTEESRREFLSKDIPICATTISTTKIFHSFQDLSIEKVIMLLEEGKKMIENNEISKKYREIQPIYVHCFWIDQKYKQEAEALNSTGLKQISAYLEETQTLEWDAIRWKTETEQMKKNQQFVSIFSRTRPTNSTIEPKPIVGDDSKKVLTLFAEAGYGKSTNLTWLAWYLRKQNPSSLVARCNLSDHCIDFKEFIPDQKKKKTRKIIDETEALRMLFKLFYSSLQLERGNSNNCYTIYANCLVLINGQVSVSEDLIKHHGLSVNNAIQLLIFKEKFNAGKLILLLDGFDEIAPHYKEVVLKFTSLFEQFNGVSKLYIASRPYGFKELFEESFNDCSFFQLQHLSLQDKGCILYKMIKENWHNGNIDDEELSVFYKWLCTKLLCSLGDMSNVPLNLMMAVDILGDLFYQNKRINKRFFSKPILIQLFETVLNISKASFTVEEFVKIKIRHLLYDKNGANKNIALKPSEIDKFDHAIDEIKLQHGLVALWVLFDKSERKMILTDAEIREAKDCMSKVSEAREKTGIINGLQDGVPLFIHRTFAEYLAAWWIVYGRNEGTIRIPNLQSFWKEYEMRKYIDTILAKGYPLHLAVIEREWATVKSLLNTEPEALFEQDDGNRTPLHLLAFYDGSNNEWLKLLPETIEAGKINSIEDLFGWTALDCAFHMKTYDSDIENHHQFIFYLLHHEASINVDTLYEQVVSAGKDKVRKAAKYSKYVLEYLNRQAIAYETDAACVQMRQFCGKVTHYLINGASGSNEQASDYDHKKDKDTEQNEESIIKDVIREDSVWMLESVIHQKADEHFVQMIRNSFFNLGLNRNSIFILKYFMANDPAILSDENLWKCMIHAVLKDYKIEFKYFFDLYCLRLQLKDFQPCPIQSDEAFYIIDNFKSYVIDTVCKFSETNDWTKLAIPTEITVDKAMLSLLVICMTTLRHSMLNYLRDSCKLNFAPSLVYPLAIITSQLSRKIHCRVRIIRGEVYECLLNFASNMTEVVAHKLLRLAMTSDLLVLSKCLIERYVIDFHAVDESNGWNVFHLFVSRPRINYIHLEEVMLQIFRCMLNKTKMDCFGVFDRNGKSILHLATENQYVWITKDIFARKLGLNDLNEINILGVADIPNLMFCYRAMHEILKSVQVEVFVIYVLRDLANQIAKILLTIPEDSQDPIKDRFLLQANAEELNKIAMKCSAPILMYYLHREFPSAISPSMYDADWLECTASSLKSPDFLDVTKWLLNMDGGENFVNLYPVVEKWEPEMKKLWPLKLEKLSKNAKAKLLTNRSVKDVYKIKLVVIAVCFKNLPAIKYLCETFEINSDQKFLFEIMELAHHATTNCEFDKPDFDPIYTYLFERTYNLSETDAEGRNVLHLAVQSGLGCMAKFLIEHNIFNVATINEQTRWNIFHFYASRKASWSCCFTVNDALLAGIAKRILDIASDKFIFDRLTESHKTKVKELCFNGNEVEKGAIQVAIEAGYIVTASQFVMLRLGIKTIDKHKIKNSDECSRFIECYDELNQIASQNPLNQNYQHFLNELSRPIDSFVRDNSKHTMEQDRVEDVCRTGIEHRCVSTLEHLIMVCNYQMNQALSRSSSRDLLACIMECIRRNRTSMFKVLLGHYLTAQGNQSSEEVKFEKEENDEKDDFTINEHKINWFGIKNTAHVLSIDRDYLLLLVVSAAYRRLSMILYLDEKLQFSVSKSLILFIIKTLNSLSYQNRRAIYEVYEYLASKSDGKSNLLHMFAQVGDSDMVRYLIEEKHFDPDDIDPENGWNAGHYCVSEKANNVNSHNAFKVFELLITETNMNCFGVYDRNGRSALRLATENGHTETIECIIHKTLGMQPLELWDMEKLDVYIKELQEIKEPLPEHLQSYVQIKIDAAISQKLCITTYHELLTN